MEGKRRLKKPVVLGRRGEEILKAMRSYRYMTAFDVCCLMYSPSSLTMVRSVLAEMSGGGDLKANQYLYRFRLPDVAIGNQKIYTGARFSGVGVGALFLVVFPSGESGHLSYGQVMHNLVLTRFLVAAVRWIRERPDFKLADVRTWGKEMLK